MSYVMEELILDTAGVTTTAAATTAVSKPFRVSNEDSKSMLVQVTLSAVSETTGLTAVIQDSPDGSTFTTAKSANIASVANVDTITYASFAGSAHGDYNILTDTNGLTWALALSKAGIKEVTSITTVADTAGSLHLKTFILSDNAGTVGFWIDVDNAGGSIPAEASACDRAVEITTVTTGMTADQVAGVLATAIDADAQFVCPAPGANILAVTDAATGARADASASTSGFTVSTTTQGAALGAAPSGALWTAVDASRKTQADISGDTTAAQVAARAETAWDAMTGFSAVFVSDDSAANGSMTFTSVAAGVDCAAPVRKNTGDTGNGSTSVAATTAGSFTAAVELENNMYNGSDTALWPHARIAVVGGAADVVTVTSVKVTRRAG
jgi:hypothetical protein